jgi:VanZ family protein
MPRGAWKQWIPAALWLAIICVESTDLLSSEHTGSILYSILTYLFGHISPLSFRVWHHFLRKAGHVFGYAVLSYFFFRAWRATVPMPRGALWSPVWARISFLMTAFVATLDEWHQTYIRSRGGSLRDIVLDSIAALGAQFLIWFFLRGRISPHEDDFVRLEASSSTAETTASAAEK